MPWFKVDDRLHDHRKARKAGPEAMGLWVLAGSWAAGNLTDGFIPADVATRWDPRGKLAARLVAAELWASTEHDGEPGWQFSGWEEWQPTKDDVEADRAAARKRMQDLRRKRSGNVRPNTGGTFAGSSGGVTQPRPVPSRPDPKGLSVCQSPTGREAAPGPTDRPTSRTSNTLAQAVHDATGWPIEHAEQVVPRILDAAGATVRNRRAYVLAAVTDTPDDWAPAATPGPDIPPFRLDDVDTSDRPDDPIAYVAWAQAKRDEHYARYGVTPPERGPRP